MTTPVKTTPSKMSLMLAEVVAGLKAGEHDLEMVFDTILADAKMILPEIIAIAPAAEAVATAVGQPITAAAIAASVPAVQAVNTAVQAIKK